MPVASWSFFLSECWTSIRRHRTATLTTLLQCISSLTVLGICLAFIITANQITLSFLNTLELVAFLEPDVTKGEADRMQAELTRIPGVAAITYVSKEQAYDRAQEFLSHSVSEMLGEGNPFPASFEIRATHADALGSLRQYLEQTSGIEEVADPGAYDVILPVMFFIQAACFFLTLILSGTTLFTIKNTIQLAILSRRTEIRVMQLVGATPAFVRVPFLLEGLAYGLIGAAVAWILVTGTYAVVYAWLVAQNPLGVLARLPVVAFNEFLVLGTVGLLVGFLGALVSVDRHLSEKYQHSSALSTKGASS